jgi:hypothetical protein
MAMSTNSTTAEDATDNSRLLRLNALLVLMILKVN